MLFCAHGSIQTTTSTSTISSVPHLVSHKPNRFHSDRNQIMREKLQLFPCYGLIPLQLTNLTDNSIVTFNLHTSTLKRTALRNNNPKA